jgi:processive 1,2-diacylglycerol beta-glucosyltransferase
MGAGHDGAARELAARLREAGHTAEVRDFLDAGPLRIGRLVRRSYEFELRHVPAAYDASYRLWYRAPWLCPIIAWFVCLLTRRRVLRWIRRGDVDIVVSTYPLATLCLGRLRSIGRLRIPAVNFITDFGVHPLWVHKGMDLNLAVHQVPADDARRQTGRPAVACGPLVGRAYDPAVAASPVARAEARRRLGLGPDDRAVLVVAGSWGIGSVEQTFRTVAGAGRFVPVVVCGRDETLRARLGRVAAAEPGRAVVLGWTDEMPQLMAACDALIENAGGLTSLEALRMGLPVVSFDPIAGHGKENTRAMADAGVSRFAADGAELLVALDAVTAPGGPRRSLVDAGQAMFVADGAALVAGTGHPAAIATLAAPRRARVVWASASRTAAGLFALAAIGWGGITTGVGVVATSSGAGVAQPAAAPGRVAYVGVRLDATEIADPAVRRDVRSLGVTVVVDVETATAEPAAVRALAAEGVDIESGGHGLWTGSPHAPASPELWTRASHDASAGTALSTLIGRPVTLFVPGRRINGFDLISCHDDHETLVIADVELEARALQTLRVGPKGIVLVNGLGATDGQLLAAITEVRHAVAVAHLAAVPMTRLHG